MTSTPGARTVLAITLAKLVLLVALHRWQPSVIWNPDADTYERPAMALLATGSYSPSVSRAPEPELNRPPGLPLEIAAFYGVLGPHRLPLAALHVLLAAAVALVTSRITARYSPRAAPWAALLVLLEPSSLHYSTVVLTETPFTLALVLGLHLAIEGVRKTESSLRNVFLSGLCLSIATMYRPISYYLIPVLALAVGGLVLWTRRPRSLKPAALATAALLLPALGIVGGWQVRNARRSGSALFSQQQNMMLYFLHAAAVQARLDHVSLPEAQVSLGEPERLYRFGYVDREEDAFGGRRYAEAYPATHTLSAVALSQLWRQKGLEILRAHPRLSLEEHVRGALCFLLSPAPLHWGYQYGLFRPDLSFVRAFQSGHAVASVQGLVDEHPNMFVLAVAGVLHLLILYALAVRGLASRPVRAEPEHVLLLLTAAYLIAASAAPNAVDDRYRVPFVPIVGVYAALGLDRLTREEAR